MDTQFSIKHTLICYVNGTTSYDAQIRSGVLQWSVLGPRVFLIHISDINNEITDSTVSYFPDVTRIFLGIKDEEDTQMLQNAFTETIYMGRYKQYEDQCQQLLQYGRELEIKTATRVRWELELQLAVDKQ